MEQLIINVNEHKVDDRLKGFEIRQKESSNVDYYGSNGTTIFMQYKHGVSYLYKNVTPQDIDEMNNAESIGRFMAGLARKKYQYEKIEIELVKKKDEE